MKTPFYLLLSLLFVSCSPSYFAYYDATLKNSKSGSLTMEDSLFSFSFNPVNNGIYFTVENKSNSTYYISWDKSYFINPNGNTFKALNTDIYDNNLITNLKYDNQTTIPSNGRLSRFTTSINNVEEFRRTQINTFILPNRDIKTLIQNRDILSIGNYWLSDLELINTRPQNKEFGNDHLPENQKLDKKCEYLSEKIKNGNLLGLGLVIKNDKSTYEYRFDFIVSRIIIYEILENDQYKTVRISSIQSKWECYTPPN